MGVIPRSPEGGPQEDSAIAGEAASAQEGAPGTAARTSLPKWVVLGLAALLLGIALVFIPPLVQTGKKEPNDKAVAAQTAASAPPKIASASLDAAERAIFDCLLEVVTAKTMLEGDKKNRARAVEIGSQVADFDDLVAKAEASLAKHVEVCSSLLGAYHTELQSTPSARDDRVNKVHLDLAQREQEIASMFRKAMDSARLAPPGTSLEAVRSQLATGP
jgi:hypothetical protein